MHAQESVKFSNISATTASFELKGGRYLFDVVATFGGGNVGLTMTGPDGSTQLTVVTALVANGGTVLDLPPGQYQVAIVTATGVSAAVTRVPVD